MLYPFEDQPKHNLWSFYELPHSQEPFKLLSIWVLYSHSKLGQQIASCDTIKRTGTGQFLEADDLRFKYKNHVVKKVLRKKTQRNLQTLTVWIAEHSGGLSGKGKKLVKAGKEIWLQRWGTKAKKKPLCQYVLEWPQFLSWRELKCYTIYFHLLKYY